FIANPLLRCRYSRERSASLSRGRERTSLPLERFCAKARRQGGSLMPQTQMERQRKAMVERQLAGRGIKDERVLKAMGEVPRDVFVPDRLKEFAYEDSALPIEAGQTISQPYIVAQMLELAEIGPEDTVLGVGAGSGYAAAVMSRLAKRVIAIELHEVLVSKARERIKSLGYDNVEIVLGDGTKGWPQAAPFDAILVAAGSPVVPPALKEQLV